MPENRKSDKTIEDAMIDSIAIEKTWDVVSDVAEVGLDAVLDEGIFKEIPIIGVVAKMAGAAAAIRDRIFAKKLLRFLNELHKIPVETRQAFVDGLDKSERQRTGETLILLLERLDQISKADILARAFSSYIKGEITKVTYLRLARVINDTLLEDLEYLFTKGENIALIEPKNINEYVAGLQEAGLVNSSFKLASEDKPYYILGIGQTLLQVMGTDAP